MVRIIGIQGKFNGNLLISLLKSLEYNDVSKKDVSKKEKNFMEFILSSDENTILNNNYINNYNKKNKNNINNINNNTDNNINNNHFFDVHLPKNEDICYNVGFCLNSLINENFSHIIKYKDLVLIFNGVIYNIKEINSILPNSMNVDESSPNIILKILYKFYSKSKNLKKSLEKVIEIINGDYVLAIFDGNNLVITRDNVGIKPLYYNIGKDYNSFASEKKSLWKIGIKNKDINSLKPGYILYNWEEFPPKTNPWDFDFYNKNCSYKKNYNSKKTCIGSSFLNIKDMNYKQIKDNLLKLLENSTYSRINGLDHIGLAFSGGVDSTILAAFLKKYKENHKIKVTLYTVGDKNSKDLKYSQKVAKQLNLPIKRMQIDENIVKNTLPWVIEAIEETNLMKIGVGMTLYLSTKLASDDNVPVVLAGQGADELFAGYNRYLAKLKEEGEDGLQKELVHDIKHCYEVNLDRDAKIANANGIQLRIPYLDEKLINFSLNIPIKYKINLTHKNNYNIPNNHRHSNTDFTDNLRKIILRDVAIDMGIDEKIAMRPKKAAQYGSGIDKILKKKILKNNDFNDFIIDIIDSD